jgi:hypothetical protein
MKYAKQNTYSFIEWISPEEMHRATLAWISELNFVRDEQKFLNNLVKSHTLELIDSKIFEQSRELVGAIADTERELISLMKRVQSHENLLEIMIDDVDQQKMEKAYRDTHQELISAVSTYLMRYRTLKKNLFTLLSEVIKKERQKRLLN